MKNHRRRIEWAALGVALLAAVPALAQAMGFVKRDRTRDPMNEDVSIE